MDLHVLDEIPGGLLESPQEELFKILKGPTLLRIPGAMNPPLLVTTLLHGNEPTGFLAMQKLLRKYPGDALPRSLWFFLGNIDAARDRVRFLPDQADYNRIWNGGSRPEHRLAEQVLAEVQSQKLFAAIDVHNNSGKNPHYACVNKLDPDFLQLGALFSSSLVYFTRPHEVLSKALAAFCPSITIECGQPNEPGGVAHVLDFLDRCVNLEMIPTGNFVSENREVFHTIAQIKVPENCRMGFGRQMPDRDFCFVENLEAMNFAEQPENTLLGWRFNADRKLSVIDESGEEVADSFLDYRGEEIRLKRSVVPSSLTTSETSIRSDCLGYFMQPYALS